MPTTALIAAGVGAAGSIGAAAIGASAQTNAANNAIAAQQQSLQQGYSYANNMLTSAQNTLSPYTTAGSNSLALYNYLTGVGPNTTPVGYSGTSGGYGALTTPFTAATLPSTPGYQFTLNQGLEGVQNSFAAQGLADSGAALKGASTYATGQAQSTYNQQLQNYLTQNAQIGNLLYQPVSTGASAASTLGSIEGSLGAAGLGGAVTTGEGIANSLTGAGNAIAGAATGASNALTGGVNTALQYSLISQQLQNQNAIINQLASNSSVGAAGAAYSPYAIGALGTDAVSSGVLSGANAYMAGIG